MLYYTYLVIGAMTGIQCGSGQIHRRSFCTGITMPETRLCDDNLPIIEIVEVSQYDFAGDEYPGRPCVYSDSDCGRAIRQDTQLYMDILTHCDSERICGGFYITSSIVCSRRFGDYMIISFRCRRDETAATIAESTNIRASSPTPQEATNPPKTTPTSASIGSPVNPPHTTPTSATTTGSPVNPPTSSGVTGAESTEPITNSSTSGDPRRDNIVAGLGIGVAVAFVVGAGCGAATVVVFNRRNRGQRPDKANLREGGGTEAGRANNEVAYYNVTPNVIPGGAAYSNVDITRVSGREDYYDVDIIMEPESKTSSVPSQILQHTTNTNLANVGAGNDTYSKLEQNTSGLPANIIDTDGQYADLTGEGPGSSEYEALGPELVVHSSEYVSLNNRQ